MNFMRLSVRSILPSGLPGFFIIGLALVGLSMPVQAADSVDETRDLASDGLVRVNVVRGEVNFKGWDRSAVRVVGTLDESTREFVFDTSGEEATIRVKIKNREPSWFGEDGSDLTIYVPVSSSIEFDGVSTDVDASDLKGSVEIGVVSGDVEVAGGVDRVTIRSVSGDVELRDGDGRIRVQTVSGDILTFETTGDSRYSTVSGSIFIEDGGEDLQLETVSGDIEVENELMNIVGGSTVSGDIDVAGDPRASGSIEFESLSGTIRVRLGGDINASFDIETGSGNIRNRLTDHKPKISRYANDETLRFDMGNGDGQVILTTRSGDISLSRN